jgi:aldose 1-epimerase
MKRPFGSTKNGQAVDAITLTSGDLTATILTRGAILQDVRLKGVPYSLTLGSADPQAYEDDLQYFGALVGPVANRLSNASASIGDKLLKLRRNEGTTSLHGGPDGIHSDIWHVTRQSPNSATLELKLPDGKDGYPGNRTITAHFYIAPPAQLTLEISVATDAPTLVNIANHSYWNLDGSPSIAGHTLTVLADHYTPVDALSIPTGVATVDNTDFDLRSGVTLGAPDGQRLDHNFCLYGAESTLKTAAVLTGQSGVSLTLETTEVGLQVFDAAPISSGAFNGHNGTPYGPFCGVALEAQRWPDAPNQAGFPSCILRPKGVYEQITRWTFSRLTP